MSSERWLRAEEIFDGALQRPSEGRDTWVGAQCEGDEALRKQVDSLLRSHDEAGEFLAPSGASDPFEALLPALGSGTEIGAYRLLSRLGEGGMCTVFLAERADGSFDRKVAVKVVRRGMESEETLRRLRMERQILANLEHPNIARLYDGGRTAESLPYFVLEWVDGQPIDQYCDRRELDMTARIDCFLDVCHAVSFAHRRMVVHRDLKPNNVLVTQDGVVKLLDFGIAKLLAEDAGSPEAATAAWVRLLTPQYASPEQVRGEPITTGTDVYSLGALLYLLLTGVTPFRLAGRSLQEMDSILSHQTPTKPSEAVMIADSDEPDDDRLKRSSSKRSRSKGARSRGSRPEVLRRKLAGDLDNIVLRALESDLGRRYSSVEQLTEDLRRYQTGLPVLARPQSAAYRFHKWVRRHRMAALGTALLIALIVSQLVSREIFIERLTEQRNLAEAALVNQKEVASLTQELFRVAGEGEALTVGQAVSRAAERLDRVVEQRPQLGADLLDTAGTIFLNLGEVSRSGELLARAAELRRQKFGEGSIEQAETLSTLAVAETYAGDSVTGQETARRALQTFRLHRPADHPDLIRPLNNLVLTLCRGEQYSSAVAPSSLAYDLANLHLPSEDPRRARAASNRAEVVHAMEGLEAALDPYREAAILSVGAFGADHPETTTIQSNLGLQLRGMGQLGEAETLLRQALEGRKKASGEHSPETAAIQRHLGRILIDLDRLSEAEPLLRNSREILRGWADYGPAYPLTLIVTADLATALCRSGRAPAGESLLHLDYGVWQQRFSDHLLLAYARGALGECLAGQERFEEAEAHLLAALEGLRDRGDSHPDVAESRRRLGRLYRAWGRPDAARPFGS